MFEPRIDHEVTEKCSSHMQVCLKKQKGKHSTALFIGFSCKASIPVLMGTIFDIPVEADDGLSLYARK